MTSRMALLVTPEALAVELAQQEQEQAGSGHPRTLVLDVRWSLDAPDGRPAFGAGHVPGAVYVDLESELSGHGQAADGRHPLPGDGVLTRAAGRWGLRPGDRVVAYDGGGNLAAARAWWLLRDAGVDVRLLDGAWPAWLCAGLPVATGAAPGNAATSAATGDAATGDAAPAPLVLASGRLPQITMAEAGVWARDAVLLDARAAERYSGATEPVDPRAGHIPGARSLPTSGNIDASGQFLSSAELRARFATEGVNFVPGERVGVYCGSGITASHALFALELAGGRGALFPGSWSQWANHPNQPVAIGPLP